MLNWLVPVLGILAGPLFLGIVLWQQWRQPSYSSVRQPISALVYEEDGWLQTVNFALGGLLVIGFAAGLSSEEGLGHTVWIGVLLFGGSRARTFLASSLKPLRTGRAQL